SESTMPASIRVDSAASINLSTVHHHAANVVRSVRETIGVSLCPLISGALAMVASGLRRACCMHQQAKEAGGVWVKYFTLSWRAASWLFPAGRFGEGRRMAPRATIEPNPSGRLARLEAENARLRRLAAQLAEDVGETQSARNARRRDGAVDPAH